MKLGILFLEDTHLVQRQQVQGLQTAGHNQHKPMTCTAAVLIHDSHSQRIPVHPFQAQNSPSMFLDRTPS